jgi:hypothetical protein
MRKYQYFKYVNETTLVTESTPVFECEASSVTEADALLKAKTGILRGRCATRITPVDRQV